MAKKVTRKVNKMQIGGKTPKNVKPFCKIQKKTETVVKNLKKVMTFFAYF